jgi:uncharacterized protein
MAPEPVLTGEERSQLAEGVRYFECHDVLEDLWSGLRGDARDFFQGLIQVAVALYHAEAGNGEGARSMLNRALARFGRYPDRYCGFDLGAQRGLIHAWLLRLESGAPPLDSPPHWSFDLV